VISGWVTDAFKGHGVMEFVSSDRQHLPPGRKWRDVVMQNLEGSEVLVAVVSPTSLKRPWPNIELGAGWIRGIPVIPFCHSGVRANQLDPPFGDFQGVNADNEDPGTDLLGGVADALKAEHPANLDFAKFKAHVLAAAGAVKHEGGAVPSRATEPEATAAAACAAARR
jgi:TIR domain